MPGPLTIAQVQEEINRLGQAAVYVSPRTYSQMQTSIDELNEAVRVTVDSSATDGYVYVTDTTARWSRVGSTVTFNTTAEDSHSVNLTGTYTVPVTGRYNLAWHTSTPPAGDKDTGEAVVFYATSDKHLRVGKKYPIYKGMFSDENYILDEASIGRPTHRLKGTYRIKKPTKSRLPEGL